MICEKTCTLNDSVKTNTFEHRLSKTFNTSEDIFKTWDVKNIFKCVNTFKSISQKVLKWRLFNTYI